MAYDFYLPDFSTVSSIAFMGHSCLPAEICIEPLWLDDFSAFCLEKSNFLALLSFFLNNSSPVVKH